MFKILNNPVYEPCLKTSTWLFKKLNTTVQVEQIQIDKCAIFKNVVYFLNKIERCQW